MEESVNESYSSSTDEDMEEDDEGSSNEDSTSGSLEIESQDEEMLVKVKSVHHSIACHRSGLLYEAIPLKRSMSDNKRRGRDCVSDSEGTVIRDRKMFGHNDHDEGDEDTRCTYHPVPLKSVRVEAALVHAIGQVQVTQCYRNEEEFAIQPIYFFPVDSNGAVTHFQAEMDGRVLKGVVTPKCNAIKKNGNSNTCTVDSGTTVIGEEKRPDIFRVSIGWLKAGQEVKVVVGYVTEVKNDADAHAMRFFLPTTITPRRVPKIVNGHLSLRNNKEILELEVTSESVAPLSIKVIASIQGEIKSVESPTHKILVENKGEIAAKPMWHKAIITLDCLTIDMDRDFVLFVKPENPIKPRLYAETIPNGSTAIMTYFVPSFKLDEQKVELIVVVDRSESMSGRNIEMAKETLRLLFHSLPVDCYFNVVGFGSQHHFMFKAGSKRCTDQTLKDAVNYAKKIQADMGGKELIAPLQKINEKSLIPGYFRQIILITDGAVCDPDSVIGLVKVNAHISRVFALGIGSAPSHFALESIAKAGNGTCAFIENDSSIHKPTLGILKNALQPSLSDIKIEWEGVQQSNSPEKTLDGYNKTNTTDDGENPKLLISPRKIPPIFDGAQLLVFGIFDEERPTGAKIMANSPDGILTLDMKLSEENDLGATKMLHRLAAIKLVRELELEECAIQFSSRPRREPEIAKIKEKILKIATTNGISSKYTSFIASDGKSINSIDNSTRTRNVPSQLPYGSPIAGLSHIKRFGIRQEMVHPLENGGGKRPLASGCTSAKHRRKSSPSKKVRRERDMDIEPMDTSTIDDVKTDEHSLRLSLLQNLIRLQRPKGFFLLNSDFSNYISLELPKLKEEAIKKQWDEKSWATVLAIRFFKTKLSPFKDLWEVAVVKSQKWILQNHPSISTDAMILRAEDLLK